jgi:transcriptional regulator with XRE-family HTH domain
MGDTVEMNSGSDEGIRRRLMLARKASKLTQAEVAKELGCSRQVVAKWEHPGATSLPDARELRDLCILYGVTPSYLLMGKGELADELGELMRKMQGPRPAQVTVPLSR